VSTSSSLSGPAYRQASKVLNELRGPGRCQGVAADGVIDDRVDEPVALSANSPAATTTRAPVQAS
jgi:hypothetical protein